MVPRLTGVVISDDGSAPGTPAGATITSSSLFGANDAARAGFMVLRVKGRADFARETCGRDTRVNRALSGKLVPLSDFTTRFGKNVPRS